MLHYAEGADKLYTVVHIIYEYTVYLNISCVHPFPFHSICHVHVLSVYVIWLCCPY